MRSVNIGRRSIATTAVLLGLAGGGTLAGPLGPAFTYQGQLKQAGLPASGNFNMEFRLFDALAGGNQVDGPVALPVQAEAGQFSAVLNSNNEFGASAFDGNRRWVEVRVNGTTLSPRQELTAAPYALRVPGIDGHSLSAADGSPLNAVYVDNAGRVGVGTTAPAQSLSVAGTVQSTSGGFMFPDGSVQSTAATGGSGFWSANGTHIFKNNAGNVGIGTNTPTAKFEVRGAGTVNVFSGDLAPFGVSAYETNFAAGQTHAYFAENGNGVFSVGAGGSGYFRGSVGIGSNPTANARLTIGNWASESGGNALYADSFDSDDAVIVGYSTGLHSTATAHGVLGHANNGCGVVGESTANDGVVGVAHQSFRSGVWGHNDASGVGVSGSVSTSAGVGVQGVATSTTGFTWGVLGKTESNGGRGVFGWAPNASGTSAGVFGETNSPFGSGVYGWHNASSGTGVAVWGRTESAQGYGGYFQNTAGGVALWVNGTARVRVIELTGADVAEKFPASDQPEPGMVMEIDPDRAGTLRIARGAYNTRVAGVVSGAGDIPVGAILGNLPGKEDAPAIALSGRVYVQCDASAAAIEVGDLLTTADAPGCAMKSADRERSHGAVIGKAMTALAQGEKGLVLVLVNLQ